MAGEQKHKHWLGKKPKPDTVVTTGEEGQNKVIQSEEIGRKRTWIFVSVGILVIVVACIVGGAMVAHKRAQANARAALVSQAASYLGAKDTAKLAPIVAKIKNEPGYAQDPNCLYVLTTYYINTSDATNAKAYYSKLAKSYNPKTGYSDPSLKDAQSISHVSSLVTFTQQQAADASKDFFGVPEEPAP